jgi:hypothetical protein
MPCRSYLMNLPEASQDADFEQCKSLYRDMEGHLWANALLGGFSFDR